MDEPIWVLEWSKRQGCFHIQLLHDAVRKNAESFASNRTIDYLIVGVGSRAQIEEAADKARPILQRRDKALLARRAA